MCIRQYIYILYIYNIYLTVISVVTFLLNELLAARGVVTQKILGSHLGEWSIIEQFWWQDEHELQSFFPLIFQKSPLIFQSCVTVARILHIFLFIASWLPWWFWPLLWWKHDCSYATARLQPMRNHPIASEKRFTGVGWRDNREISLVPFPELTFFFFLR